MSRSSWVPLIPFDVPASAVESAFPDDPLQGELIVHRAVDAMIAELIAQDWIAYSTRVFLSSTSLSELVRLMLEQLLNPQRTNLPIQTLDVADLYNIINRHLNDMIDALDEDHIAFDSDGLSAYVETLLQSTLQSFKN